MIICLGFHICVGLLVRQFQRAHSEAVLRLEKKKRKKKGKEKWGEKSTRKLVERGEGRGEHKIFET